jgi:hypothetical protein
VARSSSSSSRWLERLDDTVANGEQETCQFLLQAARWPLRCKPATKFVNDNPASGTAFTRPLCVFPKLAAYKGTGDAADAGNWACVNEVVNDTTKDADAVLPDRGGRDPDDRELD